MANVSRRQGFRPAKSLIGAPWNALVRLYPATTGRSATNNSGDIYIGDVVELSTGNAQPMTTSGGTALGVVVAVGTSASDTSLSTFDRDAEKYYDPDNLSKRYLAYDEAGYVGVVPVEAALFEVESAITLVQGATADIGITGTAAHGSRTTGNSTQFVNTATNNDVTVVEYVRTPNNDITSADAKYIVKFNKHANPIDA